jgi:purine-binding chemotaxis protein CheW
MENLSGSTGTLVKSLQHLTFFLGNQVYGFPVEIVKEVIEYSRTFVIPKTPDYIKGVINLRGEVLPVIDLSVLFYNRLTEMTNATSIIFIELLHKNEILLVGVIIDAVEAVVDVPEDTISIAPDYSTKIKAEYIKGIGKVDENFIILLNVEKILDIDLLSNYKK